MTTYQVVRETWAEDNAMIDFELVVTGLHDFQDALREARIAAADLNHDQTVSLEEVTDTHILWLDRLYSGEV